MDKQSLRELIDSLESVVNETLEYFSDLDTNLHVQIDQWGHKEMLSHLLYWHRASLKGMQSVVNGEGPFHIPESSDEMNSSIVEQLSHSSLAEITSELKNLQALLTTTATNMPDTQAIVFVRANGESFSTADRLKHTASHWESHLNEFRVAS
jgi:hypothetical protein